MAGEENQGRCPNCEMMGCEALFVGGWREGILGKIVVEYKYQAVWALGDVLAEVLDQALGNEFWKRIDPATIVIVPLPTIGRHVRERGLDHTLRTARKLAKIRGWKCQQALMRKRDTVQVGAKAAEREKQAQKAYRAKEGLDKEKVYVLLDDVWTTGATMRAAVMAMRRAGAEKIVGLVVVVGRAKELGES